jgi:hypothetical protein
MRIVVVMAFVLAVSGCATTEEMGDSGRRHDPGFAAASSTSQSPGSRAAERSSTTPSAAASAVPSTNTTPYFWFSPQLGRWVMLVGAPGGTMLPDPGFAIEFTLDLQVTFGQYHRGSYRFIERDTLELRLTWSEGPQKGQALPPILFKIAFYDNGRVMALINGANVIAFQRAP